ncbi:MAG: damage-inducible protein DinB [Ponticaulis sp.]|nr:damage-inducible protein DinB [Ponticaulis sp.]
MVTPEFAIKMARYNRWQNQSLYRAADGLSDADRMADRGAFFRSIQETLSHILWADIAWMNRFAPEIAPSDVPIAKSGAMFADWSVLKSMRGEFDEIILDWAEAMTPEWLVGELSFYSSAYDKEIRLPRDTSVVHLFNHQTHHRGQVHAMLTAAGVDPGPTDLPVMP